MFIDSWSLTRSWDKWITGCFAQRNFRRVIGRTESPPRPTSSDTTQRRRIGPSTCSEAEPSMRTKPGCVRPVATGYYYYYKRQQGQTGTATAPPPQPHQQREPVKRQHHHRAQAGRQAHHHPPPPPPPPGHHHPTAASRGRGGRERRAPAGRERAEMRGGSRPAPVALFLLAASGICAQFTAGSRSRSACRSWDPGPFRERVTARSIY